MKRIMKGSAALLSVFALSACGQASAEEKAVEKRKIDLKDVSWEVREKIDDGRRTIGFDVTNGTDLTVTDVLVRFERKADVSEESFDAAFADWMDQNGTSMDKAADIHTSGESQKILEAGESSENNLYVINDTVAADDISQYEVMEPDLLTVKYIDEGKIHTAYYDYHNDEQSLDEDVVEAYQWSDSALAKTIPAPDCEVVEVSDDTDTYLSAAAYGIDEEGCKAYTDSLKETGYTVSPYQGLAGLGEFSSIISQYMPQGTWPDLTNGDVYGATNADGNAVYVEYDRRNEKMRIRLSAKN